MDFDLSKLVLLVLAVLPGYLARRGSDRVIPRTQRNKGATEEIAEGNNILRSSNLLRATSDWLLRLN